jgi:LL-diaminopimelate aminotransferase
MVKLNSHFKKLTRPYIFPIIDQKLADLKKQKPDVEVVNLGVGDIALPLAPSIAKAIADAALEMTTVEGMRGYGPSEGYPFLRETIAEHHYAPYGIGPDEIFVSDGAGSDVANIQEMFSLNSVVGVPDPTYPVYLDTNLMAGRTKIILLPCVEENGFCPVPPQEHCDVVYLCTPNNPIGVAMTREQLKTWIDYARRENALLLIDNAYEAFVSTPGVPKTIFEIEGAKEVAVEFRSFSKSAGFTGLRCGYAVIPKSVHNGKLHPLWNRRHTTKTNGVAYPIQRGAQAVFSEQGQKETKAQVAAYIQQARDLRQGLLQLGHECFGGTDSPYIWWKVPQGMTSWEFFDRLLEKCNLISIPGSGFGKAGEGFVRLSAFTTPEKTKLALERINSCALR